MNKTIQFWDRQHAEGTATEWIYAPSDELCDAILGPVLALRREKITVLEIGCGTSRLAMDLCDFFHRRHPDKSLTMLATDASSVCIEQQRARNKQSDQCSYEVWNILEEKKDWKFDMVLDKGCVDTLLFRAKKGEELAGVALENIKQCLKDPITCPYCIITSRKKYRKYLSSSFSNIIRHDLDIERKGSSEIVKEEKNARVFLYVCSQTDSKPFSNPTDFFAKPQSS